MHRTLALLALPLVIVAVVACSTTGSGSASSPSVAAPAVELPGTSWVVTSVNGEFVDATNPPTIAFGADGTVSGTTGCNQYSGLYEVDGSTITVGALQMTLMLCEGPVGDTEALFGPALQGATAWAVDAGGNLTLSGGGDILAKPAG